MRTGLTSKKDLQKGAGPVFVCEVITGESTLYYSDTSLTIESQVYTPEVLSWGEIAYRYEGDDAIVSGSVNLIFSNVHGFSSFIEPGDQVKIYLYFMGDTAAQRILLFRGTISEGYVPTPYQVPLALADIGEYFDADIGSPALVENFPNIDPDEVGKIKPIVIGAVENLRCLAIDAGAVSTLSDVAAVGAKTLSVSDTSRFPSSGTILIGDIEFAYTSKTATSITGNTGVSKQFGIGELVIQKKTSLKYLIADHPIVGAANPKLIPIGKTTKEAVLLTSGFTINTNDSGMSTITLTNLPLIRKAISLSVSQPEYISPDHGHQLEGDVQTAILRASSYYVGGDMFGSYRTNPSNAIDGDPNTYATLGFSNPPFSGYSYITATWFNTTNRGTIIEVRLRVKSSHSADSFTVGGVGIGSSLGDRTFVIPNITAWSQLASLTAWVSGENSGSATLYEMYWEVDYQSAIKQTAVVVNQSSPANLSGNSVADTLGCDLYIDVTGGIKDDAVGHYTGTANSAIKLPKPVFHYFLENKSNGATHDDLNLSTISGYTFNFAITEKTKLNLLLAQLARQCMARFYWESGKAKLVSIKTAPNYPFPANKNVNSTTDSLLSAGKELQVSTPMPKLSDIKNFVQVDYKPDLSREGKAYLGCASDYDDQSIAKYKQREMNFAAFALRDATSATNLEGGLLNLYKYARPFYQMAAWLKLIDLELGDVIRVTCNYMGVTGIGEQDYQIMAWAISAPNYRDHVMPRLTLLGRALAGLALASSLPAINERNKQINIVAATSIDVYQHYVEILSAAIACTVSAVAVKRNETTYTETGLLTTVTCTVAVYSAPLEALSDTVSAAITITENHKYTATYTEDLADTVTCTPAIVTAQHYSEKDRQVSITAAIDVTARQDYIEALQENIAAISDITVAQHYLAQFEDSIVSGASVEVVHAYIENLLTSVACEVSLTESLHHYELGLETVISASVDVVAARNYKELGLSTVAEVKAAFRWEENLETVITSAVEMVAAQNYLEDLQDVCGIATTLVEAQNYKEVGLESGITATVALDTERQTFIETGLETDITGEAGIDVIRHYNERNLETTVMVTETITENQY